MADKDEGWLERQMKLAEREIRRWPKWKRLAMRIEADERCGACGAPKEPTHDL